MILLQLPKSPDSVCFMSISNSSTLNLRQTWATDVISLIICTLRTQVMTREIKQFSQDFFFAFPSDPSPLDGPFNPL